MDLLRTQDSLVLDALKNPAMQLVKRRLCSLHLHSDPRLFKIDVDPVP